MTAPRKPTVRNAHDYISINFGHGRVFTLNYSGAKGTNLSDEVFSRLDDFIQAEVKKPGGDYGKAVESLIEQIDRLWAEWNEVPLSFAIGEPVIGPGGKKGKVVGKARTNYKVQFEGEPYVTRISPTLLRKA